MLQNSHNKSKININRIYYVRIKDKEGVDIVTPLANKGEKMTKRTINLFLTSIISLGTMYIVDGIINPGYIYKSAIKIVMFLLIPLIFTLLDKNIDSKTIFKMKSKRQLLFSVLLGLGVYIIILGAYFILKYFIDLENIKIY